MYKLRIKIFMGIVAVVFLLLLSKLAYLQIGLGSELRQQYEESIRSIQFLPAERGRITDRQGRLLAVDRPCMSLSLEYRFLTDEPRWVRRRVRQIARAEGLDLDEPAEKARAEAVYAQRRAETWQLVHRLAAANEVDANEVIADLLARVQKIRQRVGMPIAPEYQSHPVIPYLDADQALGVEQMIIDGQTVGAHILPSHKRYYPYGRLACHLIGVIGQVTAEEMDARNIPAGQADAITRRRDNYRGGEVIGKRGLEKLFESHLRGRRGYRVQETDGDEPRDVEVVPVQSGADVHLTLDIRLQEALTVPFETRGITGAATVIGVPRGELLAAVSVPAYDLNTWREEYKQLSRSTEALVRLPLRDRALTQRYPPGSTVKPIVALCGLSSGKVSPHTEWTCTGSLFEGQRNRWRCNSRWGHGSVSVVEAIKRSCNVYFYHVGQTVGVHNLCHWYSLCGFDRPNGTGLGGDKAGFVPDDEWNQRHHGRPLGVGDARNMAIGQGALAITPLHVANAMATIARDGQYMPVRLALESPPPEGYRLPVSEAQLGHVQRGMRQVTSEHGGTAYRAFSALALDIDVCGKTGTAEAPPQWVDLNHNGEVDSGEVINRGLNMAWFAGYAPAENPQIAFSVVVEYTTEHGGDTPAALAVEIIRQCHALGYFGGR